MVEARIKEDRASYSRGKLFVSEILKYATKGKYREDVHESVDLLIRNNNRQRWISKSGLKNRKPCISRANVLT
jgi:hypothetical protein